MRNNIVDEDDDDGCGVSTAECVPQLHRSLVELYKHRDQANGVDDDGDDGCSNNTTVACK